MIKNRNSFLIALFLGVVFSVFFSALNAQNFTPSPEQLRIYQTLTPEDREQLLEVLGDNSGVLRDAPLEFPELVIPPILPTQMTDIKILSQNNFDLVCTEDLSSKRNRSETEERIFSLCENLRQREAELILSSELERIESEEDENLPFFDRAIDLEPFGYNLFAGSPTTFAPATDIPVPPDYKIGPGDSIEVQLFGKANRQYSLVVQRDGTLNFPNIGPIVVMGRNFQDLKQELLDRVSQDLIGTSAAISMGALRSIRVLLVGDARAPGSYTVSGLSTVSNALFVSGGISDVGSLRNIEVRRDGRLISSLDLYDLLIRGNSQDDIRLQAGDVIFIPPVGQTVAVGGFVKRPAIYELLDEKTTKEAIELAGGLRPDAFPKRVRLERISDNWQRSFISIDLNDSEGQEKLLRAGDILLVPPILDEYFEGVRLTGHVQRPGDFEWFEGMRLNDVISSLDDLQRQADINYVLIRRETWPEKRVKALSVNLEVALNFPDLEENIYLRPRDSITVFNLETDRSEIVEPLINELELQATASQPFEKVTVGGLVRAPGTYPYETGMRVSDLIRAGANLAEDAYISQAEISRYKLLEGSVRKTEVIKINPDAALRGNLDQDVLLRPYDLLQIRKVQDFREQLSVSLRGEVRFPGRYSFNPGDTLKSVIDRAGGLTDIAFPEGGIFLRDDLREREQQQIELLTKRVESDLASLAIQSANEDNSVQQAQNAGQALLTQLENTEAAGRLVIDLIGMLNYPNDPDYRVLLQDKDELLIPQFSQDITVLGQVQFPTSHLYRKTLDRDDYINRSGGITQNAAEKQIYLVRANGAVIAANSSHWFNRGSSMKVNPGDTIVVPLDTQRVGALQLWTDVTGVVYNVAIAVAAINGLN
ncbi:MAG: SLBB domain-containing protein [Pseudomonadota bacterium]|nr:SLBB domain-containing protein [Pseudomonadota bacterium]